MRDALLIMTLGLGLLLVGPSVYHVFDKLDMLDRRTQETQKKDAIRDMWMREHRSELMKRIEGRGQ